MKRIQNACLYQTIRFETREEFDQYLQDLVKRKIAHRIDRQEHEADGSVLLAIRRQYNAYDCGSYFD